MPTVSVKDFKPLEDNQTYELEVDEIIYNGLERQNIKLPHGCLSGSCGACKMEIIEGSENLKPPSAVEKETIEFIKNNLAQKLNDPTIIQKDIRLSCRAKITGNIKITKV